MIITKWLGLRNVSSRIDLRPETRAELLSPPRTNLSVTPPSVNRMHGEIEVQNQTLSGSEPNIDRTFEGGNMKLNLLPFDNVLEVRSQNLYGSKSSIDHLYGRENPGPQSTTGFQNRITEIPNCPQYGSELIRMNQNINYDEGRISEFSWSNKLSSSTRVGDQNLYILPDPVLKIDIN